MSYEKTYERYQTPAQVAMLFHKTPRAITRLLRRGSIKHYELIGEQYFIDVYAEWPNLFEKEIEAEKKELAAV